MICISISCVFFACSTQPPTKSAYNAYYSEEQLREMREQGRAQAKAYFEKLEKMHPDSVKTLELSWTYLDSLPDVSKYNKVWMISFSGNETPKVDKSLFSSDSLTHVRLESCGIREIEFPEGNRIELTMEEIIDSDPDVIIIGAATPEDVEALKADETYSGMRAVQDGAVYANPDGVFPWDRYSGEEVLQILWAAKFFNPDLFEDIDMVEETKNFYDTFYGYALTDDEANRILAGEAPQA